MKLEEAFVSIGIAVILVILSTSFLSVISLFLPLTSLDSLMYLNEHECGAAGYLWDAELEFCALPEGLNELDFNYSLLTILGGIIAWVFILLAYKEIKQPSIRMGFLGGGFALAIITAITQAYSLIATILSLIILATIVFYFYKKIKE